MTRVFLAAGVAALAIAAPASAERGPHGGHGNDNKTQTQQHGGGDRTQARVDRQQTRAERQAQRPARMAQSDNGGVDRHQMRMDRQADRTNRMDQVHAQRAQRMEQAHNMRDMRGQRMATIERGRPIREQNQMTARQEARAARIDQIDNRRPDRIAARIDRAEQRVLARSEIGARRVAAFRNASTSFPVMITKGRSRALIDGCPPGLWMKNNGCMPPGQAAKLIGAPLATVSSIAALSALPNSLQYLYPDTPNYYYRYGDGYLYEVDRGTNLIESLLPLIAGGYVPGQYLPQMYMNSYMPDYYGFNSFYPTSYDAGYGYGYGYDNLCNRYANGVVYQVDCYTGMIQNVVPLYASGYGYGQMLPSAYSYYNVPDQYRGLYYDTNDYGYWYAPGAIYRYDQGSNLITSVAALLSPGFSVGQQLPMGYDAYNVPYAYRSQYYDTPNAWYRYNNGYIYQVDPATQLVTAIVRSILT